MRQKDIISERFRLDDIDADKLYGAFKSSYEKETGQAWSEDKFLSRARNWTFYGDENGYVAVREQRSGMKKLVGVAGDPKSILRGLTELTNEGGPIWGAVSAPIAAMAKKRGMIVPHLVTGGPFFIKTLVKLIPPEVFGGHEPVVNADGGLQFNYEDVGPAVKYLIGNKAYFMSAMRMPQIAEKIKEVPGLRTALKFMGLSESTDKGDRYKVVWGPNQREAIGSHIVHAKSEMEAKKIGRKLLLNTHGQWSGWKVLYAVKLDESTITEKLISKDGTKVYDIQTKAEFAALLVKSHWKELRGFVNYSDDEVIAWDSNDAVHPDIRRSVGVFGVPVHLRADRITIRHHGTEDYYVWQMMRDLVDCDQLKRIYGGTLPAIYGEDWEGNEERLDNKDWSHVMDGDPADHWEDNWHAY